MRPLLQIASLLLLALPALAQESLTADQVLERVDRRVNDFKDQEMDCALTVIDTDGSRKVYNFNVKQLGRDKRLIRFTSGESKGMSVLTMEQNQVYVYLPGYDKVRKVASHNMNQSFVGSDFSNEDMASISWPELYSPALEKEDSDFWYLRLTPRKPAESSYASLLMKVGKKDFLQWQIDYFNAKGEQVKLFVAGKPKRFPGVSEEWHTEIVLSDPRTGHHTIMEVQTLKLDQGLKKNIFTTRYLEWGK